MNYNIPENIKKIISNEKYETDSIGMSDSNVLCFENYVLKIEKEREESNNEHHMMKWLNGKLPVPEVIAFEKVNGINYLLMSKIDGEMACSEKYLNNPQKLINLLADGLKMLWSIDISSCPYNSRLDIKLKRAEYRVKNNLCSIDDAEPKTYGENGFRNPAELLEWLKSNKPKEELVFSHGDYCLPNIFIKNNRICGFIDLGRAGIADKYQDIALCCRSLKSNFSGKFGNRSYKDIDLNIFFNKLNIVPDWEKIKYYILLDELF